MSLSVIIPSYNGASKLPNILKALGGQTFKDFEVIVAIDGSTDNSEEVAHEGIKQYGLKGQVCWVENKGRAGIRNYGVSQANGECLVFFDDDMRPFPECLKNHVEHHAQYKNTILVGAIIEDEALLEKDIDKFHYYLTEKWNQSQKKGQLVSPYLSAANFSIHKSEFNLLNGFNEELKDAEDFEFACRAFKKDIEMFFKPNCKGYHDDTFSMESYVIRQKEYRKANQEVENLHPEYAKKVSVSSFKRMLFKLFKMNIWVKLADKDKLLFLPSSLRYKLYDIILTAHSI